jgi:hypothetical protein
VRGIRNLFDDNMIGDQMATDNVYIYEAIRTPRGKGKRGALYSVKLHERDVEGQARLLGSPDFMEGAMAMLQKRSPHFRD